MCDGTREAFPGTVYVMPGEVITGACPTCGRRVPVTTREARRGAVAWHLFRGLRVGPRNHRLRAYPACPGALSPAVAGTYMVGRFAVAL
jgi:hypothetical protein